MACAPSKDSDQPGHPPSLIRVFAVRMKKTSLSAQRSLWSDWADAQADLSLHWAQSHFVGFVMRRLKGLIWKNRGSWSNRLHGSTTLGLQGPASWGWRGGGLLATVAPQGQYVISLIFKEILNQAVKMYCHCQNLSMLHTLSCQWTLTETDAVHGYVQKQQSSDWVCVSQLYRNLHSPG